MFKRPISKTVRLREVLIDSNCPISHIKSNSNPPIRPSYSARPRSSRTNSRKRKQNSSYFLTSTMKSLIKREDASKRNQGLYKDDKDVQSGKK